MANEFIIKNGFYSNGNSAITGSLIVSASVTDRDLQVGTNKLVVSASGNVGIGTTTPTARLQVASDATDVTMYVGRVAGKSSIKAGPDASGGVLALDSDAGPLILNGYIANNISMVNNGGNVGIGMLNGTAKLHINNINTSASFLVEDNTNPDTTPFIIDATGNVGIGTTTPTAKLHLYNDSYTLLTIERSGSFNAPIQYTNAAGTMYAGLSSNANYTIGTNPDLTQIGHAHLVVSSSGRVGIGKIASNAKLDVDGDTIITGSLTVTNNFTLLGSASIQYVTSSQLNIGDNIISVNTINPAVRFGGLAVIDSGSSPQQSGSLLFDSQNNQWIFVHQSSAGAAVTSSVLIMGPQTFNNVGSETTLTANRLTKGTGGDLGEHIGNSNITDTGTIVSINSNTEVTGSLIASGGLYAINTTTTNQSALIIASTQQNNALEITNTKPGGSGIYVTVTAPGLPSNVNGIQTYVSGGSGQSTGIYGSADGSPLAVGGQFVAQNGVTSIGTDIFAQGSGANYSVRLQDGTEAAGKVLVSQTADGKANWSTQLSGSYGLTGSLSVINKSTDTNIGIYSYVATPPNIGYNYGLYTVASGSTNSNYGLYAESSGSNQGDSSVGGWFKASGGTQNNAIQLQDGTEGIGKVLVDQGAGLGNWSTQLSGDYQITGSLRVTSNITSSGLLITGSTSGNLVQITQTGAGNAFVVSDSNPDTSVFVIDSTGSVGIGELGASPSSYSTKLYINAYTSGYSGIKAIGSFNHAIIGQGANGYAGIYGENADTSANTNIGVYGKAYQAGESFIGGSMIGGKFEAAGDPEYTPNYSVQLKDGTEAKGKVLVSQDASGSANWSTRLSGSYEITGSLTVTDKIKGTSSHIDTNALIQASLLYLSNNF